MPESWRIKRYYPTRILVGIDDILDNPHQVSLLCLTGGELSLLRNMLAYADRRSTWVSQYREADYIAPDNDQWDAIQAFVSDLEEKLMGCQELQQVLYDILAAAQCVCDAARESATRDWPAGGELPDQRDYDDYQSPVEYGVGDPPEGFPDWDAWRDYKCKAAQRIIDDLTDLGERLEVWYTSGAAITFAVFQTLVLGTAVAPPIALVMAIVAILAIAGTALTMIAFQNWLQNNKYDLVCAVHSSDTVDEARTAVFAVIAEKWDLPLGQPFGEHLFSYDVLSKAFDGGLDVDGYSADYCAFCEYGLQTQWEDDAPPCPGDWTPVGDTALCDIYWRLRHGGEDYWESPPKGAPAGSYVLWACYSVKSETPEGWTIGRMGAFRSYNLVDWEEPGGALSISSGPTGEWKDSGWIGWGPFTLAQNGYIKIRIYGQAASPYYKWYRHAGWKLVPL